jgi:hypothetical protein
MRVLSFGGGVNSVAMMTKCYRLNIPLDLIIFADTGDESKETMAVVAHAKKWCDDRNIKFDIAKHEENIVDYYEKNKVIPYITYRSCSDKFKIQVNRRHMRSLGYKKVTMLIGFAIDEASRMKDSDVKWISNEYPLIDWKMTRKDCENEIKEYWDGPVVVKSGCMGCPQGGKKLYVKLYKENPLEFARWQKMEESGRNYPKSTLLPNGPSLKTLKELASLPTLFDDDQRDMFCGGGCFT